MSGPWDRMPPGNPDESWPSEDFSRPAGDQETDRWSLDDPSSGWGSWPPPPPPGEHLPDDADLPVSDPWAESWTEDVPDATDASPSPFPPPAPPDPEPWAPYEPPRAEPWTPSDDPWSTEVMADSAPAPRWEPEPESEAEPEAVWGAEPAWPDLGESTQVLPSTWAPSEPIVTDRPTDLDPVVGRIRVSLAQHAEGEADAEEEPSTAEQAVPWLI
ncbi:MAG: hypothetical protein ACT4OQ_03290, partial [Chloroflexota bacterium]